MPLLGEGVLAIWNDVDPAHEAEFNAWYLEQHLPERLAVPGFRRARRWWNPSVSPRYFAFYEVATADVLVSPPYRERLENPTPRTRAIMPAFRGMNRSVCRVAASLGDAEGAAAGVVRLSPGSGGEGRLRAFLSGELLPALLALPGIVGAHLWEADDAASRLDTAEARLRGGSDATVDRAILVEATRPAELDAVAPRLAAAALAAHGATAVGPLERYVLLCSRTAAGGFLPFELHVIG